MRKVASESIVLLRNEGGILPLNPQKLEKIAIIGPNAKAIILSGGGSTILKPNFYVNPYDGIVSALKEAGSETKVTYSEGARGLFFISFHLLSAVRFLNFIFLLRSLPTNAFP